MSTLPTLESITSLYLYGSETPPDNLASDSIIRPPLKEEELEKINVDLKEFMEGPGRFVTPGISHLLNISLIQMMKLLIAILIHIIIFQGK